MDVRLALRVGLLFLLAPITVRAEWHRASSPHFVVYADDSERDVRLYAEQLERFHSAMSRITSTQIMASSPANRVTVYVVGRGSQVRRLYGKGGEDIAGFYLPRAGGSLAVVQTITTGTTNLDFSMVALLHEYAHHFMAVASTFPMQRWYSEGAAEFFASASFAKDGSVGIGQPAQHRAAELFYARDVPVSELIDSARRRSSRRSGDEGFYGKSWLLFHYLTFNTERRGQLTRYLRLLSEGRSSLDAGSEAFGDLGKLDLELDDYRGRRMLMINLPASVLETGPITIERLRPGEAAAMPIRIRSKVGVNPQQAKEVLQQARAVAAKFPEDPAVLALLAEAEHDAHNYEESIAAADAAIAKNPAEVDAYVQKGLSLFRLAAKAADPAGAYVRARAPFLALNRLDNDHPLPLLYYYLTFSAQEKEPTKAALDGLHRAAELAPFDTNLRMLLAIARIRNQQLTLARPHLAAVAYAVHGGEVVETARRILDRMDSDPSWDGKDYEAITAKPDAEAAGNAASP